MPDIVLLDLFCGAGGCSAGYNLAAQDLNLTIEIVGVDIKPQPNYPFTFVQADAIDYTLKNIINFSHVHASPPCQAWSNGTANGRFKGISYPDLYQPIKQILYSNQLPAVIENVPGSPIRKDIVLTGPMFGLKVLRARWFECVNFFMMNPQRPFVKPGAVKYRGEYAVVFGKGNWKNGNKENVKYKGPGSTIREAWSLAMGIDWMTKRELAQAIPPAYTRFIGSEFLKRQPIKHGNRTA